MPHHLLMSGQFPLRYFLDDEGVHLWHTEPSTQLQALMNYGMVWRYTALNHNSRSTRFS